MVCLQAPQRLLERRPGRRRGEALVPRPAADLRRDHHLVTAPAAAQPAADDRLRLPADVAVDPLRVPVGGVDEVAAGVDVGVEDREGVALVDGPAEDVRPQAEREHVEGPEADPSATGHAISWDHVYPSA